MRYGIRNSKLETRNSKLRLGFTAFEALLAAAILAFLTAAVSGALAAGRAQSRLARDTMYGSMLANALVDEVMRLPITDPLGYGTLGPDPGESRATYNCVKDYHNYADGPGTISDLAGNAYPAVYQTFTRKVTVSSSTFAPAGWGRTIPAMTVTVSVSRDGQELISVKRVACQ